MYAMDSTARYSPYADTKSTFLTQIYGGGSRDYSQLLESITIKPAEHLALIGNSSPITTMERAENVSGGTSGAISYLPAKQEAVRSGTSQRSLKDQARQAFIAIQEWEGYVTDVQSNSFFARLIDKTNPDQTAVEEAEFLIEQVSDDDLKMLAPGAIFRWSIGKSRSPGGRKRGTYEIVFRRLPAWREADFSHADEIANDLAAFFEQNIIKQNHRNETGTGR